MAITEKGSRYGGLGVIGSNIVVELVKMGAEVSILDAMLSAGIADAVDSEVLNLKSENSIFFLEMAQTMVKVVGKGSSRQIPWPENNKIIEGGDFDCDVSKVRRLLDWAPSYQLDEGKEKPVGFTINTLNIIGEMPRGQD
jgi:nucleoside-diphosphate-sugar epimerase